MLFRRHVTRLENEGLIRPFTFDEFELAVKLMHLDKALGPDGLNPAFFQFFWSVMGKEIFNACSSWLDKKELPANLNDTLLALIPKCESPTTMRDLRPIALCNVLYKIIAKVLANILKTILPHTISDTKSAFVPGRSILDNVIVAFEMLHSIKKKVKGKVGKVTLKLDISKAYNRVSWEFIMMCVSTVTYIVLVNGQEVGPIVLERGLQQGNPLSPYLFILCVEGLSSLIEAAENRGEIHGCKVSRGAPIISHLFFADDSFLFFRVTGDESLAIKRVLLNYEMISGKAVIFRNQVSLFVLMLIHQLRVLFLLCWVSPLLLI